jgi:hypothetical protein
MLRRSLAALCAVALAATSASAQLYDFEGADSPIGTVTPFSLTRGGVTVSFAGNPNAFVVFPLGNGFATLSGNVLFGGGGDGEVPTASTLEIGLSAPQTSISLLFALGDRTNTAMLTMNLFSSGLLVGSVSGTGAIPDGDFSRPEGTLSFTGASFDQAFLFTDGEPVYSIDDLRLGNVAVIPEPATVALLATGLLAVGGVATRRRRA